MLLAMFDKRKACEEMIPELTAWFDETYGMEYGSVSCEDISAGLRRKRTPLPGAHRRGRREMPRPAARIRTLSGGNAMKVAVMLAQEPVVARGFFRGKAASNL